MVASLSSATVVRELAAAGNFCSAFARGCEHDVPPDHPLSESPHTGAAAVPDVGMTSQWAPRPTTHRSSSWSEAGRVRQPADREHSLRDELPASVTTSTVEPRSAPRRTAAARTSMPTLVRKETSVRSTVSVGVVSSMYRWRSSLSLPAVIVVDRTTHVQRARGCVEAERQRLELHNEDGSGAFGFRTSLTRVRSGGPTVEEADGYVAKRPQTEARHSASPRVWGVCVSGYHALRGGVAGAAVGRDPTRRSVSGSKPCCTAQSTACERLSTPIFR